MQYLKKAQRTAQSLDQDTHNIVAQMLQTINEAGDQAVEEYARSLDDYSGALVVDSETIAAAHAQVDEQLKQDIQFAVKNVRKFAEHQRGSLTEFEVELMPGLLTGQRLIPVDTAGCYIPGGRYAHIASAIMSITTAKVAGVKNIIACSPPRDENGIHPAVLYTMDVCGADIILCLGGVQGIAAMANGLLGNPAADILVGPGNRFVAEAKRLLYGKVGIDLFAGPTEIAIIADKTADPQLLAIDLIGQAEHGVDSPVWLISTDQQVAEKTLTYIDECINALPEKSRLAARGSWDNYGEVVVVKDREAAIKVSDAYAPEHLEVHAEDLDYWLDNLTSYGSLFLGEQTTVAFGDKCSGPNHILPTKGAAKYTGGLSVGKFIKTVTYQRMDSRAVPAVANAMARISRTEGMEAHARTGDARLGRFKSDGQNVSCQTPSVTQTVGKVAQQKGVGMRTDIIVHDPEDSVGVVVADVVQSDQEARVWVMDNNEHFTLVPTAEIALGHKVALKDLAVGDTVLKYGSDIGHVVAPIKKGEHVHVHNVKTKRW